jgi:uncharacterized Tic20 family protein
VFILFPGHLLAPLVVWLAKRHESPKSTPMEGSGQFPALDADLQLIAAVFCIVLIGFSSCRFSGS